MESHGLLHARLKAAVADRGLEFLSGYQLDHECAGHIPANMIGRVDDERKLHRVLIKKKPPALLVQPPTARNADGWQIMTRRKGEGSQPLYFFTLITASTYRSAPTASGVKRAPVGRHQPVWARRLRCHPP
jgi:hypothetical protein